MIARLFQSAKTLCGSNLLWTPDVDASFPTVVVKDITTERPALGDSPMGVVDVQDHNILQGRKGASLSDALMSVVATANPQLQAAIIKLPAEVADQVEDAVESLVPVGGPTEHHYVENRQKGGLEVRADKPKGKQAKEPWEGPYSHLGRCPTKEDTHLLCPLYSLHSQSQYSWDRDVGGLTTVCMYSSTGQSPILLPTSPGPPLITFGGDRRFAIPATALPITENKDPARLLELGFCYWDAISDAALQGLQQEARSIENEPHMSIFNATAAAGRPPDTPARRALYARIPGQSPAQMQEYTAGFHRDLPALLAEGQVRQDRLRQVTGLPSLTLRAAGYIDVSDPEPQALHRDLVRRLLPLGHHFLSEFLAIIGEQPPDAPNAGYFVPYSADGLPDPWHTLPMPRSPGLALTMNSCFIHRGSGKPQGLLERRVVAFFAFTTVDVSYKFTSPAYPPLWADTKEPSSPGTPLLVNADPAEATPCGYCKKPKKNLKPCTSCQITPLCTACQQAAQLCTKCGESPGWHLAAMTVASPAQPAEAARGHGMPPTPYIFLLTTADTEAYILMERPPDGARVVPEADDLAGEAERCPLQQHVHEDYLPRPEDCYAVAHVPQGTGILLKDVRYAVIARCLSQGDPAALVYCALVPDNLPTVSVALARGYGWLRDPTMAAKKKATPRKDKDKDKDTDEEDQPVPWCACAQVW